MNGKQDVLDIIYYLILSGLVVLIIMNAKNFATAVTSVASAGGSIFDRISGSKYGK